MNEKSDADISREEVISVANHLWEQLRGYILDTDPIFDENDEDMAIRNKELICTRALQVVLLRYGNPHSNITINFE